MSKRKKQILHEYLAISMAIADLKQIANEASVMATKSPRNYRN
ncbi:MAG: hypothetical protein AAGA18_13135 [Verrucomicrobiota bacterium]